MRPFNCLTSSFKILFPRTSSERQSPQSARRLSMRGARDGTASLPQEGHGQGFKA